MRCDTSGLLPVCCGGEAPPVYVEKTVPFLDLAGLNRRYRVGLKAAFERVLDSGSYILGDELQSFEEEFASYCGAKHCVGVGNGLEALHLVLKAWGIGPGHEVIVPSNTYIATWLAVSQCGARVVPVEPDPLTSNIDPDRIAEAITEQTRAIIAVHLYGQPAEMDLIRAIAGHYGIKVLEDAAQAHGSRYRGGRVGGLADAAAFSFYPSKPLGGLGDGGCVTTDDSYLADRIRSLRNYGSTVKYHNDERGFNSRLDEVQAAFLSWKLDRLDADNADRKRIAQRYSDAFRHFPVECPALSSGIDSAWHLYVLKVRRRKAFVDALAERGVEILIHYPVPPHRQPAYAEMQCLDLPIADRLAEEVVSLPLWPGMPDEMQETVIEAVKSACERVEA